MHKLIFYGLAKPCIISKPLSYYYYYYLLILAIGVL